MQKKIKLGISSCLLGRNVRYDGGNRLDSDLLSLLGKDIELVPICPEVEAGLSVPREPMQLVGDDACPRLITIKTKQDRTDAFIVWVERALPRLEQEGISGFVLKARSPSCGVHDAELVSGSGLSLGFRAGLFAAALMERFPDLTVEDSERLHDRAAREAFLARISA